MLAERTAEFGMSPDLVLLNHASFGLMTNAVMEMASQIRAEFEEDSHARVDIDAIVPRMRTAAGLVEAQLGLAPGSVALTQNATSGAAALMRSIPLRATDQVVVLSTEYDSIVRGWEVRCGEVGARFTLVRVPLPLESTEQLLAALDRDVEGSVAIAQFSLVTSSTAIVLPVEALTAWATGRGAIAFVDIAHGPGHVSVEPDEWGVSAMFGTLHKWFPTPRPVGLLWLTDELRSIVRPGEVSLTWDSPDLVERFGWPGTFDPTPRLCVPAAIEQWRAWDAAGDLTRCEKLAEYASDRLADVGTPTCDRAFLAPRLRAAVVRGRSKAEVRFALEQAGLRGWTGNGPEGETVVRIATHVYNEESDVDRLCDVIEQLGPA